MIRWLTMLAMLSGGRAGYADTLTVTTTADSGWGSLRYAIGAANVNATGDHITFAPALAGRTIRPLKALPALTQSGTEMDGDLNDDGVPDITVDGVNQASGPGLRILNTQDCIITGLAIVRMPVEGILISGSNNCKVRSCRLGVNAAGTSALPNGGSDLSLLNSFQNVIGGGLVRYRNIIGATGGPGHIGIYVSRGVANSILRNYIGVKADGVTRLGSGQTGIALRGVLGGKRARVNHIGGSGHGNVFGGLVTAVRMDQADDNGVYGNYFGLGADGKTALPISGNCIAIGPGCTSNVVGDGAVAGRNLFAGSATAVGVSIVGPDTVGNEIRGNYFGFTADGTARRRLNIGVVIGARAGAQVIGRSRDIRNSFGPNGGDRNVGVLLDGGGRTVIRSNDFGGLPNSRSTATIGTGVEIHGVSAKITYNTIVQASRGISVDASPANPSIYHNTFSNCRRAVKLTGGARCSLGNLSDRTTTNDGANSFALSDTWHVYNATANHIKAEGNMFGTTSKADIDSKIWDGQDARGLGVVDFTPLQGGVIPTGGTEATAGLTVTGAAAVPTAVGAEVLFTLSAPADVTVEVLNIAGRSVALLAQERAANAGLQRIAWNGHSLTGTAAPTGRYLVRITARGASGQQAMALASLALRR